MREAEIRKDAPQPVTLNPRSLPTNVVTTRRPCSWPVLFSSSTRSMSTRSTSAGLRPTGLDASRRRLPISHRAIASAPRRADFRWNQTAILRSLGRLPDAEAQGQEAVRLAPDAPEAHNNLASVLKDLGRQGEAVAHYRRALELKPDYADAWSNLAWALSLAGQAREAEDAARQALAINPRDANALNNCGTALMQQDRLRAAGECFERAVAIKPDFSVAHSNALFCLNYRTDLSSDAIFAAYRAWDEAHAKRLMPASPKFANERNPAKRLRVGYVSPDFRHHAVSFFIEPLLAAHDRTQVEITCYAEVVNPDPVTARFKALADRWRSTVGLSDAAMADLVRADGIDILVDLGGHTSGNRLLVFARKPAPVQVAHMVGSGTTTGMAAMDAFLADEALVPVGAERHFSERVVRLSRIPLVYAPPAGMPEVAPASRLAQRHRDLRLLQPHGAHQRGGHRGLGQDPLPRARRAAHLEQQAVPRA